MGDSFPGLFGWRFTAARAGRREAAQPLGFAIDEAEVDVGEADDPVAAFGLGDADDLAGQRFADEHELAAPLDLTVGSHTAHGVVGVVPGFLDPIGILPRRGAVVRRRRLLAERLVRALVIVGLAEAIEAGLLRAGRRCRRTRGLSLERAMQPLVPAVLLRRPRI